MTSSTVNTPRMKIQDLPLIPAINGTEKIPTGGFGDYTVSINQLRTYIGGGAVSQLADLKDVIANTPSIGKFLTEIPTANGLRKFGFSDAFQQHQNNTSNPHQVTATQIGLGNVNNTSDADKPISYATKTALDNRSLLGHTHTQQQVTGLVSRLDNIENSVNQETQARIQFAQRKDNPHQVTATQLTTQQSLAGTISRSQHDKNAESVSVKDFGAVGNYNYYPVSDWYTAGSARYRGYASLAAVQVDFPHVTDATDSVDFAAIQAAINVSYGRNLIIPSGSYFLRAARADKILDIRNRINIIGHYGVEFIIASTTPNTQDVMQINPSSIADEGVELHNIWVYEQSGSTPARDILRVNLDATHGLKKLRLFGCLFRTKTTTGRAIRILNPSDANANGLFSTDIHRCEITGGLYAEGLGDSVRVKDNSFAGINIGIEVSMLSSASSSGASAKLSIKDNNITSQGGGIVINRGRGVTIADNNIEQLVDLTSGACIIVRYLDNDASGKSVITNNKIEPNDPTSKCNGISLYRCKNTAVINNQIGTSAKSGSYTSAVLVNECENLQVHYNDSSLSDGCIGILIDPASKNISYKKGKIRNFNSNFTEIENSSVNTSGVRIFATLLNSWASSGTQYQAAQFTKRDGMVYLDGVISKGVTSGNDLIMVLPVGMRPIYRVMSVCYTQYGDGSLGFTNVRIDPDGNVYLSKRSNTSQSIVELSLNGIYFNAPDA